MNQKLFDQWKAHVDAEHDGEGSYDRSLGFSRIYCCFGHGPSRTHGAPPCQWQAEDPELLAELEAAEAKAKS